MSAPDAGTPAVDEALVELAIEARVMRRATRVAIESVIDAADDKHYVAARLLGNAHRGDACETCGLIADLNAILATTERSTR